MWADPAVTRYIGGKPSTEQQTWARLLGYAGHWQLLGFGYWAVEERATGEFVGEAGLADFKRDIEPSMRAVPELGFAFASRAHGKGYASESVAAVIHWADEQPQAKRTVCLINEDHAASLRVVRKFGYEIFGKTLIADRPVLFLERIRP